MLSSAFLAAWFAWAPSGPSSQDAGVELVLEIGVAHYAEGDRRTGSWAGDSGVESFQSYVWTDRTLCGLGASDWEPAQIPAIGWHVAGRVVKRAGSEALVQIDWQRQWDKSARLTDGPKGSLQVTLHVGLPLELDRVVPASPGMCGAITARLEAAISLRPAGRVSARGWSGRGGIEAGSGGGGSGGAPASVGASAQPLFVAELWLVHRLPNDTYDVTLVKVPVGAAGSEFAFPSVPLTTARGAITIEVTGRLRGIVENGTLTKVQILMARRARGDGPPPIDSMGGTSKELAVPAASEVISFELPSLQRSTEDLLAGHQFSLRLRVPSR